MAAKLTINKKMAGKRRKNMAEKLRGKIVWFEEKFYEKKMKTQMATKLREKISWKLKKTKIKKWRKNGTKK